MARKTITLTAALAATLLTAGAACAQAARPAPEATIKLQPWRNRWVLEAGFAGQTRKYLFDTGAGLTLVSDKAARAAGCEPWGRLTGYRMMGERSDGAACYGLSLTAGGVTLTPPVLGLIDMGALNPRDAELDGVVGLNLFENRTITLDFAAGTLTIETPASARARIAAMRPIPIRLKREVNGLALAASVAVPSARGPLLMELDSGNGGTVLVSKPVAREVGLDPAVEGKQHADFRVATFADGSDVRAVTDDAFTPDMIMDGNLGMPFLRNWVITLDLKDGLAWIGKPAAPPAQAIPLGA